MSVRLVIHCEKCGYSFEGTGSNKERAEDDAKDYMLEIHSKAECKLAQKMVKRLGRA